MGYAIAAAVAIPVGLLDQFGRLRARPAFSRGIWLWWCGRVALECAVAAGALYLAKQLDVKYSNEWYGWLAAGLLGASLAKSHLAEVLRGERVVAYGLISIYERIRGIFEKRIDDSSASRQSDWINNTILPGLKSKGMSSEDVADRLEDYVRGLGGLTKVERDQELAWIQTAKSEKLVDDPALADDLTRKSLVRRAAELRAWSLLETMIRA